MNTMNETELTPKQRYEQRKAERQRRREAKQTLDYQDREEETQEIFDRFVTAVERIADALERR